MYISGFTFIRNALKYDYPIKEAILSILPLCDELIVAVGKSEDNTRKLIEDIGDNRIRIIDTIWNDQERKDGKVLALETNKALAHISPQSDWIIYIQGDECMHENDHPVIKEAMNYYLNKDTVEALLFRYKHFYGSYDYIAKSRQWYRHEIRILKPKNGLSSYKDAQGFRINGRKIKVASIPAHIYHYGWVKHPKFQQAKQKEFHKLWHPDEWLDQHIPKVETFDYSNIDHVENFEGTHPIYIRDRIVQKNWEINLDPKNQKRSFKDQILHIWEKYTGKRLFEYRNYHLLETYKDEC